MKIRTKRRRENIAGNTCQDLTYESKHLSIHRLKADVKEIFLKKSEPFFEEEDSLKNMHTRVKKLVDPGPFDYEYFEVGKILVLFSKS